MRFPPGAARTLIHRRLTKLPPVVHTQPSTQARHHRNLTSFASSLLWSPPNPLTAPHSTDSPSSSTHATDNTIMFKRKSQAPPSPKAVGTSMSADTLDTVVAASTPDSVGAAPAQIDASVSAGAGVRLLAELPPPPLDFRWVHTGSRQLDLPTVPVSGSDLVYRPFSSVENTRLEDAWNAMSPEVRDAALETWGNEDGEWGAKGKKENKDKDKAVKEADKKGREKDKEREKEKEKEKEKRKSKDIQHGKGSNDGKRGSVSSIHEGSGTLGVALSSGLNSDTEVNEVPVDKPELYRSIIEQAQNDPERLDVVKGVPVAQDSLFEVDLDTLSLHPVFWPQTGARIPVMRGTWFMSDETKPCGWDLAAEIEKGYQEIKPWLPSYQDELAKALIIGPSGEEKLKYPLPAKFGNGLGVVFEDESRCRIIASGAFDYLSRYVWSSIGSKPSGIFLYRGFTAASTAKEAEKLRDLAKKDEKKKMKEDEDKEKEGAAAPATTAADASSGTSTPAVKPPKPKDELPETLQEIMKRVKGEFESKRKAMEEANAPIRHAKNDDEPCTDLVLVIHGIGQNLAEQYESFSFIYASNQLRQVLRKQSLDPAIGSIVRNRRIQILPVQWRANLKMDSESSTEDAQYERENVFTISDITISKSIPYVREVTNSVLLDIPLFMSGHKTKMIEAVCQQANRQYRMWIARNPEFEKNGRVHVIGHSLGSALAAEILSHQPTTVPALSHMPKLAITEAKNRFVFNTRNLFLAGSPLGVFLQLQQAHVIARTGRTRTLQARPDEAFNLPGRFGCMAVDNLYNIFYPTDPVAYAINPAVDVRVAKERPPLDIPNVTPSMFPSLPNMPSMPAITMPNVTKYMPSWGSKPPPAPEEENAVPPQNAVEMELKGGEMCLMGTRGERRFAALNPRGALDFALPSTGVNDYLDMITAHGNYWNDPNFGAFVLNETFATAEDEARTGPSIERLPIPGSWEGDE